MKIFLSILLLISFAFSDNLVYSKYSKEFLEKNVLPSLQNEDLKTYYVNCYDKLVFSDDEITNNGWVIPEECNMFKYPIKSNFENKILQIGKINKDKINLLKEQIYKIKEKEKEVQDKLKVVAEKSNIIDKKIETVKEEYSNIVKEENKETFLKEYKFIIVAILLILILIIYFNKYINTTLKVRKKEEKSYGFNVLLNKKEQENEIENINEKVEVVQEQIINEIKEENKDIIDLNKEIEEKIIVEEDNINIVNDKNNDENDEECAEDDEECVCKKYNIRFKKERVKNV